MKSNRVYIVFIIVLLFTTLISLVYAFIQSGIATAKQREALEWAKEAEANGEKAKAYEAIGEELKVKLSECESKLK
jgi:cytochrome b subunit of formate dehydrogenase